MRFLAILLIVVALAVLSYLVVVYGGVLDQADAPSEETDRTSETEEHPRESNNDDAPNGETGSSDTESEAEEKEEFWELDWVDPAIVDMPRTWRNPRDGAEYVLVPGGVFTRGSNTDHGNGRERPKQQVFVSSFYIGRYAVSRQQFERFIEAGGYTDHERFGSEYWTEGGMRALLGGAWSEPATWDREDAPYPVAPQYPVTGISWYEAHAYARFVGGRLPREVEWEKAARGTDGREYPWGEEWKLDACNWRDVPPDSPRQPRHEERGRFDGYADLAPVDAFEEYASPYGVVQMAGNTLEWCQDWLDETFYQRIAGDREQRINPRVDIQNYEAAAERGLRYRVLKGGAFDRGQQYARPAYRHASQPFDRDPSIGMRVVIDVSQVRRSLDD